MNVNFDTKVYNKRQLQSIVTLLAHCLDKLRCNLFCIVAVPFGHLLWRSTSTMALWDSSR